MDHQRIIIEYENNLMGSPELLEELERQNQIQTKRDSLFEQRFQIEERLFTLYSILEAESVSGAGLCAEDDAKFNNLLSVMTHWINDTPESVEIRNKLKSSKYSADIIELEQKCENIIFEEFMAEMELDEAIEESRDRLFSKEYKNKMREYAEQGILLYDINVPLYPILDDEITSEDILDSFLTNECSSLHIVFGKMLVEQELPVKLRQKVDDLKCAIIALVNGELRSSARNLFALLEGEHKDCASAWDNYFKVAAEVKKGKARSEEITRLTKMMNHDYYKMVWNIVDLMYKSVTSNSSEILINRNAIIHGDYGSDKMDISEHDVVKLMLLYCNMRVISCKIQAYTDMLQNVLNYGIIIVTQELNKSQD